MKALGIGQVVVDKSFLLEHFPIEGTKMDPIQVRLSVGSPVPSALVFLSKLGVESTLITSIDKDVLGNFIKKELFDFGVKVKIKYQKRTRCNILITNKKNGSRTILKDKVDHQLISKIEKRLLNNADLLFFDRKEPKAFDFALKNKNKNTKIIIDSSTEISKRTLKMIQYADYPIIPVESIKKLDRKADPRENLNKLFEISQKTIFITCGSRGTCIYDGNDIKLVPTYKIQCIDSLGAGDVYRGAFGWGVLQGWDLFKIVDYANLVSALQCTKIGNSSAIPNTEQIENFQKVAEKRNFTRKQFNELLNK